MRLVKNYKNYWMLLRSILGAAFYRNKLRCLILYILYCLKKVDTMCKKYIIVLSVIIILKVINTLLSVWIVVKTQ